MLVASITSPSAAFSRKQKEFKLVEALNQLNEEQQNVLQMRYGQGLPSKEIASKIGKSDGATRVLITRSLKKLEGILEQATANVDNDQAEPPVV
jgi:RNA polymerase sigma-70 factor (ECF subfamily)